MAMLYVLIFPLVILVMAAISALTPSGLATLNNAGPHGLSEMLYAFSSMAGNNGSAFAGLGPNRWYNIAGGFTMLIGRFLMRVPMGALPRSLVRKTAVRPSAGTLTVTT